MTYFKLPLITFLLTLAFAVGKTSSAVAADLRIYGFADLVASQATTSYPVGSIQNTNESVNYDSESRLGLNLSADLGKDFMFAGQMLAKGDSQGEYNITADWIFVTYKHSDSLGLRVGRQINPIFLYSEQVDVGFTYLWARLPSEVYGAFPVKSFNGLSIYHTLSIGEYKLQSQIFGGGGDVSISQVNGKIYGDAKNTRGLEFSLTGDNSKFHTAYLATNAQGTLTQNSPFSVTALDFGTFHIFTVGGFVDLSKFFLAAEGCRIIVDNGSFVRSSSSAYGSVGYHLNPLITPYLTYAWQGSLNGSVYTFPDLAVSTSTKKSQHSAMLGLNYKATPSLAVKAEVMREENSYNDSSVDFGANVYTVAMDIVF